MALTIDGGITIEGGISVSNETPDLVLSLDASNPSSYSGTGTTWYDLSGLNNNTTLINSPPWTSSGSQSFFTFSSGVAQGGAILPNTTYTKVGIIRVAGVFGNFISGDSSNQHAFWGFFSQNLQSGHNGNWNTIVSTNPVPTNQWVFVAVSFSYINGWRLYLNTDTVVTDPSTDQFAANPAVIVVGGYDGNGNQLAGDVAIAQIYNRVLTDGEIAALYSQYQARFGL
jgi:hypothetical protein